MTTHPRTRHRGFGFRAMLAMRARGLPFSLHCVIGSRASPSPCLVSPASSSLLVDFAGQVCTMEGFSSDCSYIRRSTGWGNFVHRSQSMHEFCFFRWASGEWISCVARELVRCVLGALVHESHRSLTRTSVCFLCIVVACATQRRV